MSKVVKGVGKIVKQTTRAFTSIVKGTLKVVKKVAKSKIGKAILIAAAIYFTGGAALGAMSSAAAGGSALAGASAGLSSAWAGVTGVMSGGLGSLGGGWAGAAGVGAGAGAAGAGAAAYGTAMAAGQGFGAALSAGAANAGSLLGIGGAAPGATTGALPVANPGALGVSTTPYAAMAEAGITPGLSASPLQAGTLVSGGAPSVGSFGSPLAKAGMDSFTKVALLNTVGGAAKGAMQAKAQNDAQEYQSGKEEEDRARYNRNMGAQVGFFDRIAARYPGSPA